MGTVGQAPEDSDKTNQIEQEKRQKGEDKIDTKRIEEEKGKQKK